VSRICLCLTGATLEQDVELLRRGRPYVDLVELRADFLEPAELAHLARFPALVDVPAILTMRRTGEGGRWRGAEADRRRLLRNALGGAYAFVDLEMDLRDSGLEGAARARGSRVIRSLHDFRGVPADLAARVRSMARAASERGELPMAAVLVRGSRDQRRLAEAFRELRGVEQILTGLGPYGSFSRILAGKLGSWLTYCSPGRSPPSAARAEGEAGAPEAAPGQLDPRTLVELYRFRAIGPETAVYGLVGNPIAHSRSPHIHNRGYSALGLDAVYVPFLADELAAFLRAAEALGVRGLSVTVPFKQRALRLARNADAEARAVGAANTLLAVAAIRAGAEPAFSGWLAANTDVAGFLAPLERAEAAEGGLHPGGKGRLFSAAGEAPAVLDAGDAVVLGAGGAARAVVHALTRHGLRVLVLNRTPARARALARRFECQWGGLDTRGIARLAGHPALIVQTTTVGLDGAGDPLPEYGFRGDEIVYDLVYSPPLTPFLARAHAAGCRTIGGLDMLRAQAEAQFRLFTGREYPAELKL
jgi:3-dehydroquinate dehydratase/shikimate dehydrogenase